MEAAVSRVVSTFSKMRDHSWWVVHEFRGRSPVRMAAAFANTIVQRRLVRVPGGSWLKGP
jgi:hypothetical protein